MNERSCYGCSHLSVCHVRKEWAGVANAQILRPLTTSELSKVATFIAERCAAFTPITTGGEA
jgi:hypothetical protein